MIDRSRSSISCSIVISPGCVCGAQVFSTEAGPPAGTEHHLFMWIKGGEHPSPPATFPGVCVRVCPAAPSLFRGGPAACDCSRRGELGESPGTVPAAGGSRARTRRLRCDPLRSRISARKAGQRQGPAAAIRCEQYNTDYSTCKSCIHDNSSWIMYT